MKNYRILQTMERWVDIVSESQEKALEEKNYMDVYDWEDTVTSETITESEPNLWQTVNWHLHNVDPLDVSLDLLRALHRIMLALNNNEIKTTWYIEEDDYYYPETALNNVKTLLIKLHKDFVVSDPYLLKNKTWAIDISW